jgi:hypothetical protein
MALLEMQGMETREHGVPGGRGSEMSVTLCDSYHSVAVCLMPATLC